MEYDITYYNNDGDATSADNVQDICAKKLVNSKTKSVRYFVLMSNGSLYNPTNIRSNRRTRRDMKFVKTTEVAFLLYVRFLKSRNNSQLLHAQRNLKG